MRPMIIYLLSYNGALWGTIVFSSNCFKIKLGPNKITKCESNWNERFINCEENLHYRWYSEFLLKVSTYFASKYDTLAQKVLKRPLAKFNLARVLL